MKLNEKQIGYIDAYINDIEQFGGEYFDNSFLSITEKFTGSLVRSVTDEVDNRRIAMPSEGELSERIIGALDGLKDAYKNPINGFIVEEKRAISEENKEDFNKDRVLSKMPSKVSDSDVKKDSEKEENSAMNEITNRIIMSISLANRGGKAEVISDLKLFVSEQVGQYVPALKGNIDELYSRVINGLNERTYNIKCIINDFDRNLENDSEQSELYKKNAAQFK